MEDTWPQAQELFEVLSGYPHIRSIVGGIYATMAPEIIIENSHVEYVGSGEGEETIIEFCEAVRQGQDTLEIMGFAIESGKLVLKTDEEW